MLLLAICRPQHFAGHALKNSEDHVQCMMHGMIVQAAGVSGITLGLAAKSAGAGICMCRVWCVMLCVIVAALMEKVPSIEALVANDSPAVETVKGFTE